MVTNIAFDLVVLPFHDWKKCEAEGFRDRDAHLLLEFEKHPAVRNILVIDRPISVSEILLKRRYWRARGGSVVRQGYLTWLTRVSPKIYVLDIVTPQIIRPLLLRFGWWGYIFRQPSIIGSIKSAIKSLNMHRVVLFLWSPLSTGVVGKLGEELLVFDAFDNWLIHPEITTGKKYIKEGQHILKEKSDLIFTNSQALKEFLGNDRENVFCIPNGVSKDFFKPGDTMKVPEDLRLIPHPRIGYAGKLSKRIDIDLMSFLATRMPDANFVFIGPILNRSWIKPLFKFKNIHFLGDKHYSELPAYLSAFDICLIPNNVSPFENYADPIKLYEYLSAGKPVVTTNIAGVDAFEDVIAIAGTKEEFLEGVRKYLVIPESERKQIAKVLRDSIPSYCFWENKANQIIANICKYLKVK